MRVIILANRAPVTGRVDASGKPQISVGGLASALHPVVAATRGAWLAARTESAGGEGSLTVGDEGHDYLVRYVGVPDREYAGFYQGLSNRALWPLLHALIPLASFSPQAWNDYVRVNERFAEAALAEAEPGDLVWVQDYHLMLVPRLLRHAAPALHVGFFLHVPFPPFEVFRVCPWARELVAGLLGADLVGFHTRGYVADFLSTVARALHGDAQVRGGDVRVGGRAVEVRAFPIGIDATDFEREASSPAMEQAVRRLRAGLRAADGRVVALAVDRLDYTKGILERLFAMERFFTLYPHWRRRLVLVQVAVPSRTRVDEYRRMKAEIEQTVGRINGAFGAADWMPIRYLYRSLPRAELVTYYRAADVALVTPLRDGMNLVAKEFIATRVDDSGVIVLSELAGAAAELHGAVRVNPYDTDGVAHALAAALAMPRDVRRQRMRKMRETVRRRDTHWWASAFLRALVRRGEEPRERVVESAPAPSPV